MAHMRFTIRNLEVNDSFSFQSVIINLIFPDKPKTVSWFPPANIWYGSGYSVGQWTEECEEWFKKHVSDIKSGNFRPIKSTDWRTHIRHSRAALKLAYQMKKGAASFISEHHDQLSHLN